MTIISDLIARIQQSDLSEEDKKEIIDALEKSSKDSLSKGLDKIIATLRLVDLFNDWFGDS